MTTDEAFEPLPGSERQSAPDVSIAAVLPAEERVEATLFLRRRNPLPAAVVEAAARVPAAEFAASYGAEPADIALVTETMAAAGITVLDVVAASRSVVVNGPSALMEAVFGTRLSRAVSLAPDGSRVSHRHRTGGLSVPATLSGVVVAVLGLDDRPQARPFLRLAAEAAVHSSYSPLALASHYAFPPGTDGSGQRVAVIELGGGFAQLELDAYFGTLGITGPTVEAVPVDGADNVAGRDPDGADGEVLLDLEVIGALAPAAGLLAYFAPNTDRGFVDAIAAAANATPTPTAISISWGGRESSWTAQARAAMDAALADAAALGVTVTAAAGDNGSGDGVTTGVHVDYPASSPYVLACGGTRLPSLTSIETVWGGRRGNGATGGGVSEHYSLPSWQQQAGVPLGASKQAGRGVPDVAGDADPQTGYAVRIDGRDTVIGGTSAVAPLWCALLARLAQALGGPLGLLAPRLYAGAVAGTVPSGFRDIVSGSNGAFRAGPGWDPCTGLGTPDGALLLQRLQAQAGASPGKQRTPP